MKPYTYIKSRAGRGLAAIGIGTVLFKSKARGPKLGSAGATKLSYIMHGYKWRCEAHGHQLDNRRSHCPIDNSPCSWQRP